MHFKSLICITSCNRLQEIKKYILPYIDFCNKNQDFDFILSLDGNNKEYLDFCNKYQIPLVYSDKVEGVCISKNRVLSFFPDYDNYFFIDDDVELVDSSVFKKHVFISHELNIPHLSVTPPRQLIDTMKWNEYMILYSLFGGAYFNFFTREGLKKVGGWHTKFAKYKRFGHTEHTYRYFHQQLTSAPFIIIKECLNTLILHDPPHVSDVSISSNHNQLIEDEQKLINEKISFFPVTTLYPFYFNNYNMNFNQYVFDFLQTNSKRYPLLSVKEKRNSLSEYFFFKFEITKNYFYKLFFFICSVICKPDNLKLKHWIKTKLIFPNQKHDVF